ncbi:hypothetical protein J6590_060733 [Homalodisca vitripennis]|nr:hypothetical protein J6590_060733 [Homalodisca vitripennis]
MEDMVAAALMAYPENRQRKHRGWRDLGPREALMFPVNWLTRRVSQWIESLWDEKIAEAKKRGNQLEAEVNGLRAQIASLQGASGASGAAVAPLTPGSSQPPKLSDLSPQDGPKSAGKEMPSRKRSKLKSHAEWRESLKTKLRLLLVPETAVIFEFNLNFSHKKRKFRLRHTRTCLVRNSDRLFNSPDNIYFYINANLKLLFIALPSRFRSLQFQKRRHPFP